MLYIHIPFCKQLCSYCDFYFSLSLERKSQMMAALLHEMELRKDYLPLPLSPATLYFGGGTPSLLSPDELNLFITKARLLSQAAVFTEITVEANPDDLTPDYVAHLLCSGVNRLSIGIQSFHDHHLKQLRRRHSARQAVESVRVAQAAGFRNITIDLMYGLPGQTLPEWEADVQEALRLEVPHISAYHLSIEPKTLLGKQHARGLLQLPEEETGVQQFLYLHNTLEKAGYEHYEISNFAREGFRGLHNSGYWQGFPYLGIGPSAHSYNGTSRQWNVANNIRYIAALEKNAPAFERENLTPVMRFNEYVLTALRTAAGMRLSQVAESFGEPYRKHCLLQAQPYIDSGKVVCTGDSLRIPAQHFIVSDEVIRALFWV
jgi:oxygen-independent coproporphyrinogen-3 oxidase